MGALQNEGQVRNFNDSMLEEFPMNGVRLGEEAGSSAGIHQVEKTSPSPMYTNCCIGKHHHQAMIDTGAMVSVISKDSCLGFWLTWDGKKRTLQGFNAGKIESLGCGVTQVKLGECEKQISFHIID